MMKWKNTGKKSAGLALLILTMSLSGCGQTAATADHGDVALIEPEGIALNYEEADYRSLYDAKIVSGMVYPYTELFEADHWMQFQGYGALAGTEVKKGDALILTNTEGIEERIKNQKEAIAQMQEAYNEYWAEKSEELAKQKSAVTYNSDIVTKYEARQPQQYITQTDENGNPVQAENPEYTAWYNNASYHDCKKNLMKATAQVQQLEEAMRQRTELFNLDLAYQKTLLNRLQEDRKKESVVSGMTGVVTGMRGLSQSDSFGGGTALMAVSDLSQKYLKTDFINKAEIGKAEEIYAIVDGKRYEVEYQAMESEEYTKLKDAQRKIYSTFRLIDEEGRVEFGSFGVVVVRKQSKEQVLTVPQSAITWTDNAASVYVLRDGNSENVPIQVGMKDGMYAEVLSGIEPGDRIITEKALVPGKKTITLQKGTVQSIFSEMGSLEYPVNTSVVNPVEYGTAYLEEIKVKTFQEVQKGDVLMTIRVVPDQIGLERKQKELQRAKERLEDTKAAHKDDTSKEYLKYLDSENERIADLEEVIQDMKKDFATTQIKAPISGIVVSTFWGMEEGKMLSANQNCVYIAEQNSNFIALEDKSGQLTYGMEATIQYSDEEGNEKEAKGKVVTVSQTTFERDLNDENTALIQVSAEDIGEMAGSASLREVYWNPSRFKVTVAARKMENVVLIPKSAVTVSGTTTYVKLKKENGEVIYQSFVAGGSDTGNYWVAEGLTEGMEVCIE